MIKLCKSCQTNKSLEEFGRNKRYPDGRQLKCKECRRAYDRQWYATTPSGQKWKKRSRERQKEIKAWFFEHKKTLKCNRCEEDHPATLDFHHKDPSQKDLPLSEAIQKWSKKRILKEIAKCEILCANCHRKLHWEE